MGKLEMINRPTPATMVEFVVEDDHSGSGHVQIACPAPFCDFFEPAMKLCQVVEVGQSLGQVCDHLGNRCETMTSKEHGVVMCLRTFSRVLEGDSVAAIMELPPAQNHNSGN
jgi:predicted deacylase